MENKILMPKELTAENGAKYAFIGEFKESVSMANPVCAGCIEDDCEYCDEEDNIHIEVAVSWTTIKEIYKKAVALFGENP